MKVELVFDRLIMSQRTLRLVQAYNLELINIGANGQYLHAQFEGRGFEIDAAIRGIKATDAHLDAIYYDMKEGLFGES